MALFLVLVSPFTRSVTTYAAEQDSRSLPQQTQEKPTDPEGLIVYYSNIYQIDPELPLAVADAESDFKNVENHLYDGENGYRTAYGIFQFTRRTWKGYCSTEPLERMNVEKNIECAVKMISQGQIGHWNESRSDWIKKVNPSNPLIQGKPLK